MYLRDEIIIKLKLWCDTFGKLYFSYFSKWLKNVKIVLRRKVYEWKTMDEFIDVSFWLLELNYKSTLILIFY